MNTDSREMTMAAHTAGPSFAGPRDRESFFEAQKRNRRATWRISAASVAAVMVMGIPLALSITPLLYAAALFFADIVNIWAPLPAGFWQRADEFARYGILAMQWLTHGTTANPEALALGATVLLLPGAALSVGLWLGINALFRRAGVGGALLALKAREPNPSDLKELRLVDVVQEMAIAAGLPAPRIVLIDAPAANAAAIGTSPNDARIVVSRRLLDDLSRDELEGAMAHLVASVGNGDLRIAFRVTSVFETYGLLLAIINAPFGGQSRGILWRIIRYAVAYKTVGEASAEEAAAVAALLTRSAGLETDDIDNFFDTSSKKRQVLRSVRNFLLLPIFFTNFAIKLSLWFFSLSMLGPCMALLWRKRKYLADASAVQLTRNPDGLAEALRKMNTDRDPIPGGAWASHLFLVSPAGLDRVSGPKANAAQEQIVARIWAESAPGTGRNAPVAASSNLLFEIAATAHAATAGDSQAMARMNAFRQAVASALDATVDEMPNVENIAAAQQGDRVALQRLMAFGAKMKTKQPAPSLSQESSDGPGLGFAGFHPSLKRRLKRLDRMGAHVEIQSDGHKAWIVIAALFLFLGPFALLGVALILILIAVLSLASLAFVAIWMAFIHGLFGVFFHH